MRHTERGSSNRRPLRTMLFFVAAAALTSAATHAGDLPPQEKPGCPPTNGPSRRDRRASDPVQLSTLRYVEDVTDLVVPSPTGELRFSRHYRSHEETSAGAAWHPLGGNWRHSFEAVAVPHIDAQSASIGSIEMAARDGRVDLYLPIAVNPIAAIDNWRLTWDAANNKTRRRQDSFGQVMTASYGYDAINRLLTAGVNVGDPSDPDSKDPRFRDPSTPETYHLDGVHNRISVDSGAAPGSYTMLDGCGLSPSAGGCDRAMNRPTRSPIAQYLYDGRGNTAQEESSCIGDATGDHQVTTQDLSGVIARFGQTVSAANASYDLNNDGLINTGDLTLVLVNYGKACDWTEHRYDWANRLVEVKSSSWGGVVAGTLTQPVKVEVHRYQYDALGRRIARTLWAAGSYGSGIPSTPKCTRMIYGGVGTTADAAVGCSPDGLVGSFRSQRLRFQKASKICAWHSQRRPKLV